MTDSSVARAIWWKLARQPLRWRKEVGAGLYGVDLSADGRLAVGPSQNGAIYLVDAQTRSDIQNFIMFQVGMSIYMPPGAPR